MTATQLANAGYKAVNSADLVRVGDHLLFEILGESVEVQPGTNILNYPVSTILYKFGRTSEVSIWRKEENETK
jgi:hypothetical protein